MRVTPAALRPWRSSIRARIVIACAGLFLVPGAILIGAAYTQVGYVRVIPPGPRAEVASRQGNVTYFYDANNPQIINMIAANRRRAFLEFTLAGLGLGTLLAAGLGWAVSRRVLRPLTAVTTAAQAASQENLDHRLALAGPPDELKELADTFDAMLARLEAAFASQRRFVANASHELRTPLTEMRTLIDVTTARPAASAAQLEPVLAAIGAAVDKSEELIEALLTLARSDRGPGPAETGRPAHRGRRRHRPDRPGRRGQADPDRHRAAGRPGHRGPGPARTAGQQPHRQRRQAQRDRRLGTGQHQDRRRHRRTHRRQRRRAHPRRPGNRAVRAVPPPLRPDRQPARHRPRPVHRGIGRPCAWRPRPGPRQARRRTRRADHAACHGKRAQACPPPTPDHSAPDLASRSPHFPRCRSGPRDSRISARFQREPSHVVNLSTNVKAQLTSGTTQPKIGKAQISVSRPIGRSPPLTGNTPPSSRAASYTQNLGIGS